MTIKQSLLERSGSKCELCSSEENLDSYEILPNNSANTDVSIDQCILICGICQGQIENPDTIDPNHWHCLNDSMWTPVPAVQVMAWRILNRIKTEGWPQDLLDMLYLEEDVQTWAEADSSTEVADDPTFDSNGVALTAGDSVTLIKDLVVKGANFTAKRGTVVKNISLTSNPKHIEGKVNGTRIVLVSAFLKKA
ncbi:MAG TPA: PhnA domain protein [Leucothrix sp.]|nr:PhnA domain protein [Leucothrix sp.]